MMPAGRYFIGDLCYVMHDKWDLFCEETIIYDNHSVKDGEFTLSDGTQVASYCTYFGDGLYYDEDGKEYPVDAGLIGCILVSDITDHNPFMDLGRIVEFKEDFETCENNGTISIGHIHIETNPECNEEE